MWVDRLVGLALLAEIELQAWLSAGITDKPMVTVGGVVVGLSVAFRRRWPLRGVVVLEAVLLARTLLGGGGGVGQTLGQMPSLILIIYGMGAFAPPRRSQWVLAVVVWGLVRGVARVGRRRAKFSTSVSLICGGWLPQVPGCVAG